PLQLQVRRVYTLSGSPTTGRILTVFLDTKSNYCSSQSLHSDTTTQKMFVLKWSSPSNVYKIRAFIQNDNKSHSL
ncbi:hypothetical protein, partial [Vibrio cholerae]